MSLRHQRHWPYIIWWAIAVHLAWGVALVADASVLPLVIFVGLHWIAGLGLGGTQLGLVLIAAALLAAASLVLGHRLSNRVALALLLPQYALLVAAFLSDAQTIATGSFEGRDIDRLILFVVLWPIMIAAALHSAAIIERHVLWNSAR